jgi:putative NADPH-quinone reductase
MKLFIYAHPYKDSHSYKALQSAISGCQAADEEFKVIDLYQEGFNPLLTEAELKAAKARKEPYPDVAKYQELVTEASTLVFVYPIWWYAPPAIMKGFLDRVITAGFAYNFKRVPKLFMLGASLLSFVPGVRYLMQPHSAKGHFKGKDAVVIRTYGGPPLGPRVFGHKERHLEQVILRFCGITRIKRFELFNADTRKMTEEKESAFYGSIKNYFAG